jgi:hypothetical protein
MYLAVDVKASISSLSVPLSCYFSKVQFSHPYWNIITTIITYNFEISLVLVLRAYFKIGRQVLYSVRITRADSLCFSSYCLIVSMWCLEYSRCIQKHILKLSLPLFMSQCCPHTHTQIHMRHVQKLSTDHTYWPCRWHMLFLWRSVGFCVSRGTCVLHSTVSYFCFFSLL